LKKEPTLKTMSLNAHYILSSVTNDEQSETAPRILEVAGAPVSELPEVTKNTIIHIQGFPNSLGDGDTPSNFRYKKDTAINNGVCERWMKLFEDSSLSDISDGIYVTTFPREGRLRSYKMNEDGSFVVSDKHKNILEDETTAFETFFESVGLDEEKMKILREASAGARYNTYLADMLSFLMMIYKDRFVEKYFRPYIVNAGDERLQPVVKGGRTWTPIEGNDYLYFDEVSEDTEGAIKFYIYDLDHYHCIYEKLLLAISPEENSVKADIRKFFSEMRTYERWSDYAINDVDDILTIYMIINSFVGVETTGQEDFIKSQFDHITDSFFSS
jgi:hypothetical protein